MKIKFWGVRGSIPCPGPNTVKYGGNTACIEIYFADINRRIIIDAGSGIRELGNYLLSDPASNSPVKVDIFLSHSHWDHIMGFPFFGPIYIPTTKLRVYGPVTYEDTIKEVIGGQFTYRYFPVRQSELSSDITYIDLKEGCYDLGDGIKLTAKYLNHPVLCLGYRFEYQGKVFCTVYDTEPFQNIFCTDPADPSYDEAIAREGQEAADLANSLVEAFFSNADLIVYDVQYTRNEYESSKVGWGHTSIEYAISSSIRNKVKQVALFHHDPVRTDRQIDELTRRYCNPTDTGSTEIFFAREGMEINL